MIDAQGKTVMPDYEESRVYYDNPTRHKLDMLNRIATDIESLNDTCGYVCDTLERIAVALENRAESGQKAVMNSEKL